MNSFKLLLNSIVISAVLGDTFNATSPDFAGSQVGEDSVVAPYVVGGQEARPFQYPFIVHLRDQARGMVCGGSIIARNMVLTAAHCIGSRNPSDYVVTGHRHNTRSNLNSERGVTFRVKQVVMHPSYSRQGLYNDVALLILDNNNPSAIPGANMDNMLQLDTQGPREGSTAKIIGWGKTSGNSAVSAVLKETDMRIDSEGCRRTFGNWNPSMMVCGGAMRQGESVCGGDSGGPFVIGNTLVGVVSYSSVGCNAPYSGFAKVAAYVNWINQYRNGGGDNPSTPNQDQPDQPQPQQPQQNWQQQQQKRPQFQQQQQNWQRPQQNWQQQRPQSQWPQQNVWQRPQQQQNWWS